MAYGSKHRNPDKEGAPGRLHLGPVLYVPQSSPQSPPQSSEFSERLLVVAQKTNLPGACSCESGLRLEVKRGPTHVDFNVDFNLPRQYTPRRRTSHPLSRRTDLQPAAGCLLSAATLSRIYMYIDM